MRSCLVFVVALCACGAPPVSLQPPEPIAAPGFLDQYAETHRFRSGRPTSIRLTPKGDAVFFLRSGPRSSERTLYSVDPKTGIESEFLTAKALLGGAEETLSAEEKALRERMRLSARGIARYAVSKDGTHLVVPLSGRRFLVDRQTKKARPIGPKGATAARLSPDDQTLAVVVDGDVHLVRVADGETRRLTTRPSKHVSHGVAEFVAQEEMGRYAGMWFSPDSQRLVYQRTDVGALEQFLIADPSDPANHGHKWPYPRPGKANAEVRLFVTGLAPAAKPVEIRWDRDTFPYLARVRWTENAPLVLTVQNRRQTVLRLLKVDPGTGETRTLLEETDTAWINLDGQMPRWLPDGSAFLWTTERNGGWQLELRDKSGERLRALNPPEMGYRGLAWLDAEGGHALVYGGPDPTLRHLFRVRLDGASAPEQVTTAAGQHYLSAAREAPKGVLTHYPKIGPATWSLIDLPQTGPLPAPIAALTSKAETPPFEAQPTWVTVEVPTESKTTRTHHATLVRPRNFDARFRYPVVLSIYAGPGVSVVNQAARWHLFDQWLADHGFIVVKIDGRGTPRRGRAWERIIKNDLVTVPLDDQVAVLEALGARFPELDVSRVGVWGWSYGGYMAAMATIRRPEMFRAGVAGAPVADWRDYDTHYTERFLGLPEPDKAGYDKSSVLTYAKDLRRPLLIIHGTADDNVYFIHALKLSDALFKAGKHHEFLPLAGQTHMVTKPAVSKVLYGRVVGHLRTHLGVPILR